MFKLPLSLVARARATFDIKYSIGLESPDREVAEGATKLLNNAIGREVARFAESGKQEAGWPGSQENGAAQEGASAAGDEGDTAQPAYRSRAERKAAEREQG
jgi:hypothetical protein